MGMGYINMRAESEAYLRTVCGEVQCVLVISSITDSSDHDQVVAITLHGL